MSGVEGARLDWTVRVLLALLVAANGMLLFLLRTGGSLIGFVFYVLLFVVAACGSDRRAIMVGGLVGLGVHVAEVAVLGWPPYPNGAQSDAPIRPGAGCLGSRPASTSGSRD